MSTTDQPQESADDNSKKTGLFGRLRSGLAKTRSQLAEGVGNLLLGEREIDESVLEDLETALLLTDVGIDTTQSIMEDLAQRVKRKELNNTRALHAALANLLERRLQPLEQAPNFSEHHPHVIFFVGVNGVGKTTTIGKLAKQLQSQGQSVMLAAGDTFRAAAEQQLKVWGERNQVSVVSQEGGDAAAVIFDAIQSAQSKGLDVVLADTAGRLPTQLHLMEELKKVKRVIGKAMPDAPHEVLLVIDANTGQNAVNQVKAFDEALGVTGLILTKLDGTAKGGAIAGIARYKGIPVRYVGTGEGIDDLRPFDAAVFVDALFA